MFYNFPNPVLLTRLYTGHVFEITSGGNGVVLGQTTRVKSFPGHAIHVPKIVDMPADRHLVMREHYYYVACAEYLSRRKWTHCRNPKSHFYFLQTWFLPIALV